MRKHKRQPLVYAPQHSLIVFYMPCILRIKTQKFQTYAFNRRSNHNLPAASHLIQDYVYPEGCQFILNNIPDVSRGAHQMLNYLLKVFYAVRISVLPDILNHIFQPVCAEYNLKFPEKNILNEMVHILKRDDFGQCDNYHLIGQQKSVDGIIMRACSEVNENIVCINRLNLPEQLQLLSILDIL